MERENHIGAEGGVPLTLPHILRLIEVEVARHEKAEEQSPRDNGDDCENHAEDAGSVMPRSLATSRMCAMREGGMPDFRQLNTVEGGASKAFANLVMPSKAETTISYSVCICDVMR